MMATPTLTKTPPSIEGALRIPPVEANLLPVEIVEARRGRVARRIVVTALVALFLVITGWYGQARYRTSTVADSLQRVEDDAQRVQRQQRDFADLLATRAESQAIETRLSGLVAGDLSWSRLLFSLRTEAPSGVKVTSVVGALFDDAASVEAIATRKEGAAIGKLTVSGTASTKAALATYVDRLGRVAGLTNPLLTSATEVASVVQFSVQLDITTAALGGRHTSEAK
jgi:Tfp pilus assembly protein PilN